MRQLRRQNGGRRPEDPRRELSISFMAQRMTLEADDAAFDEIAKKAAKACARVDDDCCVILK